MCKLNYYRIIDANINRVAEGVRVLEDISRFIIENPDTTNSLRELRHRIRKSFSHPRLANYRNAAGDIGLSVSAATTWDNKGNISDLVTGNFKRIQEGIRSIEEHLKILGYNQQSKVYETLRFSAYQLEKNFPLKRVVFDGIYGITGETFATGKTNVDLAKEMIAAGITVIQYREKEKSKLEKYHQCQTIRRLTLEAGTTFIVNDDLDIALAVTADGIHIGQDDLPLKKVRQIAGNMIIGVSTHNPDQAKAAVSDGADYIGVGPIFSTNTKKNLEKSGGLKYLEWVAENISIPHVAIGGIKEENIAQVKKHGGKCFAIISELAGAHSIEQKVAALHSALE
ncbi:thiamine phosphate synthase [Metallumcola ferriviriculae]|uniref:Thiamine-phosphate synthase n=1 Tax=Metallumcola ferriviriculae TaxID=3039180 RepID=A0AAU0UJV9_9FIRM|nr:thiamine phosphate synthase [Desulfitibacteraceae bacterium MK1]